MEASTTVQITMPEMGDSVTEGTVLEWLKQVGDEIAADEPIVEVSTDKVDAEVPAPAAGVLTKILVEPDQTVAVGAVLGEIDSNGAAGAAPSPNPAPEAAGSPPAAPVAESGNGAAQLVDVAFPEMGDSVAEGTILEWRKQIGDAVAIDDPLVEISTDKVDAEVPAPVAGTVAEILVEADQTVPVGTILCRISDGGGAVAAPSPADAPSSTRGSRPEPAPAGNGNATPVATRIASAHGIDVSSVSGTGKDGRVTKQDVLAAVDGNGADAEAPTPATGGGQTAPIRGPAATLVKFMNESRTIPTATSFRTVPVAVLDARRRALKEAGRKLSFTHLIAWAIVEAAGGMPVMANSYAEADGKPQRVTPEGLGLGLAVDVERKDGSRSLVVPVVHGADGLAFEDFVARYDELVAGARDNELPPDAYQGANITLTNPGGLGTVASVPRLMPGQGTIVATGAIAYPPGFAGADPAQLGELGVTKVMTMTSTYDHRVIQGAESGSFLRRIDQLLQGEEDFYARVFGALGVELVEPDPAAGAAAAGPAPTPAQSPAKLATASPATAAAIAAVPPADRPAKPAPGPRGPATADEPVPATVKPAVTGEPDEALLQAVQAATSVVKAHRMHGHLAARLDPLGSEPTGDPALDPETVNLSPELMARIPASVLRVAVPGDTFAEALPHLQDTYCGTLAYEIEHISTHEQRIWLRQMIESGEHRRPPMDAERRALLERLTRVEGLEHYFHKAFLGKKQFSIEGLDTLIPMLDETIELAAEGGAREVVLGMAHRGRLNVLAHVVGRPYEALVAEFEGEQSLEVDTAVPQGGTGDVKYHHGAAGTYRTRRGKGITVTLSPNPSHLEYVDPVIEGRARADQSSRKGRELNHDPTLVVPVLIHGDAAFPAQGVVAETLNLQALDGYSTGGTIHIITNNQLGFTTEPRDARSTRYASDLAKGFDVPIVHVNADDVEGCIAAVRLAMAFRDRFGRDLVIDQIGYRRYGHNETDEPAYTQPAMYTRIAEHPPVRKLYSEQLAAEGTVSVEESEAMAERVKRELSQAHEDVKDSMHAHDDDTGEHLIDRTISREPRTSVSADLLRSLNEQLLRVPEGFSAHRKLGPQLERRRETLGDEGGIDWGQAEALAFATLLCLGVPVRLTGQDTERGTFSHRHLVLHDPESGDSWCPMQNLPKAVAPFELHNSPLSETACVGFEYGYSVQAPDALVLWEAQFGDFVNAAQVIVDQFLVSGLAKWGQSTRLTLLLPHGHEGSGPEHSSGRLERFLQLAAEGNIRVANPTTAGQYFHLLRRQALVTKARPLIVMTPKSLLRAAAATSTLADLADGAFEPVIDDSALAGERDEVTKLVLCSGKIYYDIVASELREHAKHVAVARVELLYPFAERELIDLMSSYPKLEKVVWVQEEPRNMGARAFMRVRMDKVRPEGVEWAYVGRELRASPGEGYAAAHRAEQARIVRTALE